MTIKSVIDRLAKASGPARTLDAAIAEIVGWKKQIDNVKDSKTGEMRQTTLWIVPAGSDPGKVPNYTSSLQAAYDLAHALVPGHVAGCSWEGQMGSARIDNGPIIQAATPHLALCVAALTRFASDSGRE